jgi:CheY-like chemotaxis protein
MRALLSEAFCDAGYRVTEVADGRQLSDCLAGPSGRVCPKPDIVVSDIRMPGHSGLEVLAALRNADWAMPVILITAFGNEETHAEARRLGAVTVLDKPLDVEQLVEAVQSIVPAEI